MTAVNLLWVNLVMDAFAALALATEAPTPDLLEKLPDSSQSFLVTRGMWRMIWTQAVFQVIVMLTDCVPLPVYGWDSMYILSHSIPLFGYNSSTKLIVES